MTQSVSGLPRDMLFLLKVHKSTNLSTFRLSSDAYCPYLSLGSSDGNLSRKQSKSLALYLYWSS